MGFVLAAYCKSNFFYSLYLINNMKIAIIEVNHFQYPITQAEIFSDCKIDIYATEHIKNEILDYAPFMNKCEFIIIDSIEKGKDFLIEEIKNKNYDLVFINPIFEAFKEVAQISKEINSTKIATTHNINTWFNPKVRSLSSLKERLYLKKIIDNCDYIAVEDFIYNYLKETSHKWFRKHNFLYIPFTIFSGTLEKKYTSSENKLKVVLPGNIDGKRRRYEDVLEVIKFFAEKHPNDIHFSFAGRAYQEYGKKIHMQLDIIKKKNNAILSYFDDNSTVEMFKKEMETSDIVLSTSTKTYSGLGTLEYIGKTKPTAAIHDMMTYELPGLLPKHLKVPKNLIGSVINYSTKDNLIEILENLLKNRDDLNKLKAKAKENSLNFTAPKIRAGLPF